ncbi:MAG: DUF3597 domain-containing protein [Verrucomicrobiae bacterium]|nr:DUF3597 domain-containing protein [Verrucomicrobiae bacterium]
MSLFSKLMGKVFGSKDEAKEEVTETAETATETVAEATVEAGEAIVTEVETAGQAPAPEPEPEPMSQVDVEAMLDEMEKNHPEDLDWKLSIVDLLKLLDLDSSYGARKEMALELGYSQEDIDGKGSAEMNIWLHKQVMKKIAENGGKLPADLLD